MNQRVHNLSKWKFLEEGRSMHWPGRSQRTVIVDVNCPSEVAFYVRQQADDLLNNPELVEDEEAGRRGSREAAGAAAESGDTLAFVALVKGRDRLEFAVDGPFDLVVEGGSAYVFSADGQDIATRIVAPEIYTRIANRRQRNPHLEMMEYQMRLNQERFRQEVLSEAERRVSALERKLERYAPQRDVRAPPERVGKSEGWQPGPEGELEASAEPAYASGDESGRSEKPAGKRKKAAESEDL